MLKARETVVCTLGIEGRATSDMLIAWKENQKLFDDVLCI